MKKSSSKFMKSFNKTLRKAVRGTKKHSPLILLGTGIAAGIGASVSLYKSRPKIEAIVEDVEEKRESGEAVDNVEVGTSVLKAVGPALGLGLVSVGSFVWSYNIQHKRITAISGVLAATQAAHKKLQTKVRKKLGEEAYNELLVSDHVTSYVDKEDGTREEIEQAVMDEYDKAIGEWYYNSTEYCSDGTAYAHEYNMQWIYAQADKLDHKLFARGTITLNEVRDALGFDRIPSGAMVGWTTSDYFRVETAIFNEETPNGEIRPEIFVTWTAPHYIYDVIEYDND